jgi:hypothetical protein
VTDDLRRPLLILGVVMALVAVAVVIHAVRSGGLTRFQQLNVICDKSLIGPFELIVNGRRIGDSARLLRPEGETPVKITERTAEGLTVADVTVSIRYEGGESVVVGSDSRVGRVRCRTMEFRM